MIRRIDSTTFRCAAAVFALPLMTVAFGRAVNPFSSPRPASANAVEPVDSSPAIASPIAPVPPEELQAIHAIELAARGLGPIGSPFPTPEQASDEPVEVVVRDEPVERPPSITPPSIRVTSIVRGARPIAVIDGAIRRVGDLVDPDWMVYAIDADARTVSLGHRTGEIVVIDLGAR